MRPEKHEAFLRENSLYMLFIKPLGEKNKSKPYYISAGQMDLFIPRTRSLVSRASTCIAPITPL